MKQHASITTMPVSPDTERHRRMLKYTITMGIRIVCIVLLLFVHGWWLLVVAVGAIVLPYIAVVIANVAPNTRLPTVQRPGLVVPVNSSRTEEDSAPHDQSGAGTDSSEEATGERHDSGSTR